MYLRETPTQVFSCEHFEIFKNTYFEVLLIISFLLLSTRVIIDAFFIFAKSLCCVSFLKIVI